MKEWYPDPTIWSNPTQPDPTQPVHGWTRPMSNSELTTSNFIDELFCCSICSTDEISCDWNRLTSTEHCSLQFMLIEGFTNFHLGMHLEAFSQFSWPRRQRLNDCCIWKSGLRDDKEPCIQLRACNSCLYLHRHLRSIKRSVQTDILHIIDNLYFTVISPRLCRMAHRLVQRCNKCIG